MLASTLNQELEDCVAAKFHCPHQGWQVFVGRWKKTFFSMEKTEVAKSFFRKKIVFATKIGRRSVKFRLMSKIKIKK